MKKIIAVALVLVIAAFMVVNCFAVSTVSTDLDLIYFDDFSDPNKHDYRSDTYDSIVKGGYLSLYSLINKEFAAYVLPGSDPVSGKDKLTFAISFKVGIDCQLANIVATFGGTDNENFYTAGVSTGNASGAQFYYSPVVGKSNAVLDLNSDGKKDATRAYAYLYQDQALGTPFKFNTTDTYTLIVELEKGSEPVFSVYSNGELITLYHGTMEGGYTFAGHSDVTYNGQIGIMVTRTAEVLFDAVAVYSDTGLDKAEIIAKVYSKATNNETNPTVAEITSTPAVSTKAPADTTKAPVDTIATPADTTGTSMNTTSAPADTTSSALNDSKGGCGGVIGIGLIAVLVPTATLIIKKKRNNPVDNRSTSRI